MVTDINRKQRLRRQYIQMAVFCSCVGLFAAFAAAVYFSDPEIDFSDVKQIWEGIRDIKGNVLFVCMFIGGMAVAFFDLYQYYGYLRERNSLRDEENGSAKWGNEEKGGIEKYNRDYLYSPKIAKSVEVSVKETFSAIDANKKVLKGKVSQRVKDECFKQSQITNIEGPKQGGGDSKFWNQTRLVLLSACCAYLFESRPMEQKNFTNVMEMLRLFDAKKMVDIRPESAKRDKDGKEIRASEEELRTQLDLLFEDWEAVYPTSYAVKQYKIFQMAGRGKTSENILISTAVTLGTFFDNEDVMNLTYKDELHLEQLGERKAALFIVTPQGDTTYGFLCSMLYNQLFDTLYRAGDYLYGDFGGAGFWEDMWKGWAYWTGGPA